MVTRRDYPEEAVRAARSVLVEVWHTLGDYTDHMVLVGGWVPKLILDNTLEPHSGSIDVDLALDHRSMPEEGYRMVCDLLLHRGYRQGKQPFIFTRQVRLGGNVYNVELDLLAGEYGGTGRTHRTQRVQDARPRKARGCDLAFDECSVVQVRARLPEGGLDSAEVKVASVVPFLVMKGMALASRLKEKDAYDIYYCLVNYGDGPDDLVGQFKPQMGNRLVQEGLAKIGEKFGSPEDMGPVGVVDFQEEADPEERERIQRDAYERVAYLLARLGLPPSSR